MYSATTPERSRATSMPRSRPDTTIERAVARRSLGARSPTSGIMSCGVTVVSPVMNVSARKTWKLVVTQRPTQSVAVIQTRSRIYGRRRRRSPGGLRRKSPTA